jgi:hypothetical protein
MRKNDCGDSVSFLEFGKEIFKQVESKEGTDGHYIRYASPSNIDMTKYSRNTTPQRYGTVKQSFVSTADDIPPMNEVQRYIGKTYVPQKGKRP